MKQRLKVAALMGLGIYFLLFLAFFISHNVQGGPLKTGFLVVAADRGFLGNQEIDAVMDQFKRRRIASLALIGKDRQGIEDGYAAYIRRAVAELEQQGVSQFVVVPMFLSAGDALFQQYRDRIGQAIGHGNIQWAPPMAESYLTAQILLDRVEAVSTQPSGERLVVLGSGAVDEASERRIRNDLERLAREVTDRHEFREVGVHVYYEHGAPGHEEKNEAVDARIIRTAARRGRTLLVPFAIGVKFDQRMSMEGWMGRKFGQFDIALGKSLFPHPDVLTWLHQTANRYSRASREEVGVLIMPHGSTRPYNDGLERVVAPLRGRYRVEMAPGMGDPLILGQAVRKLEKEGVTRIIFIRMYALRDHMKARTDYMLGLAMDPPGDAHGKVPPRIRTSAVIERFGGYEESPLIAEILLERIMEISERPEDETVILLAHGTMDDEQNRRWIEVINDNIARIQKGLERPFRAIKAMTLREDWPDKRARALLRIREEIEQGNRNGGRVLVVSNRLYGSGPYQRLLEGLDFKMNGKGLVPHPNMTRWLEEGIGRIIQTMLPPASLEREAGETAGDESRRNHARVLKSEAPPGFRAGPRAADG
ncbi:MAG TPA: hypothetical protein ENK29_05580 [Chromatiales bacterium]|nr:hypothetical protein [Chromatiales bacterium]